MVAYFAGVTQAPITAFVMEMTDDHEMLLPPMAAALIAKFCSHLICSTPLFHTMAQNFMSNPATHASIAPAQPPAKPEQQKHITSVLIHIPTISLAYEQRGDQPHQRKAEQDGDPALIIARAG